MAAARVKSKKTPQAASLTAPLSQGSLLHGATPREVATIKFLCKKQYANAGVNGRIKQRTSPMAKKILWIVRIHATRQRPKGSPFHKGELAALAD